MVEHNLWFIIQFQWLNKSNSTTQIQAIQANWANQPTLPKRISENLKCLNTDVDPYKTNLYLYCIIPKTRIKPRIVSLLLFCLFSLSLSPILFVFLPLPQDISVTRIELGLGVILLVKIILTSYFSTLTFFFMLHHVFYVFCMEQFWKDNTSFPPRFEFLSATKENILTTGD